MDAGLMRKSDDQHLVYAAEHGCVIYTFNASDSYRLHTEWIGGGREHAGIILGQQQRFSVGEQLRRILLIRAAASAESMRNRVEFLSNWY